MCALNELILTISSSSSEEALERVVGAFVVVGALLGADVAVGLLVDEAEGQLQLSFPRSDPDKLLIS